MRKLKLLKKYKHFKGKEYVVLGISTPTLYGCDYTNKVKALHTEINKLIDIYVCVDSVYKCTLCQHKKDSTKEKKITNEKVKTSKTTTKKNTTPKKKVSTSKIAKTNKKTTKETTRYSKKK